MSLNDQILADRRQTWHAVARLLFWGTIHVAVFTIVVVMFALNGPTATTWVVALFLIIANLIITATALLSRK
jgi:hypothetical protein